MSMTDSDLSIADGHASVRRMRAERESVAFLATDSLEDGIVRDSFAVLAEVRADLVTFYAKAWPNDVPPLIARIDGVLGRAKGGK